MVGILNWTMSILSRSGSPRIGLQWFDTKKIIQTFSRPPALTLSLTVPNCFMVLLLATIKDTLGSMDPFRSLSSWENSLEYMPIGRRLAQHLNPA